MPIIRNKRIDQTTQRKNRVRAKLKADYPRLSVFRSNKFLYAQIIDDKTGTTLAAATAAAGRDGALALGKDVAAKAVAAGVKNVVFDRGGYSYEGSIKVIADSAREAGLIF